MTETVADWCKRGARDYDDGVPEIGAPTGPGREHWLLGWRDARDREERGEREAAEQGPRCAVCRWWHENPTGVTPNLGLCRAVTPVATQPGMTSPWPVTQPVDWCAGFKARESS